MQIFKIMKENIIANGLQKKNNAANEQNMAV